MRNQNRDLIAWALLIAFTALSILYHWVWMPVSSVGMDPDDFSRGIGTPLLLWLNGYLGSFFNLRFLGTVVGFALPILLLALLAWRRLERWQRGLLVFVLLAVAVIGGLGGFNYRYALTLLPLFTVAVFSVSWLVLRGRSRSWFVVALVALNIFNTVLSFDHRQRSWEASEGFATREKRDVSFSERLDTGPRDLLTMLEAHGVGPHDTVLVNNLPYWYYATDRPGIYYWCGSDQLFMEQGKAFLFRGRTEEEVVRYLVDELHCRYLFSATEYKAYGPRFSAFLDAHTELLEQDDRGYTLRRLKDTFGR